MNNIFPSIHTSRNQRESRQSMMEFGLNFESWVRVKYKKKWYEVYCYDSTVIPDLEVFAIIKATQDAQSRFTEMCINVSNFYILDKQVIKDGIAKRTIRKSYYPYSEKSRLFNQKNRL